MSLCEQCGATFEPPRKSKRRTCSRSCHAALGWARNRGSRLASISAAQKRRSAEIVAQNHRRWARPGEREKLSQRNREAWTNPATREKLSAGIRKAQSTPEKRQFYSDMRRALWRDPAYRARVTEIIRTTHRTEEYRALFSALLRERWQDPVWREKWIAAMRRRAKPSSAPAAEPRAAVVALPPPAPPPVQPERPKTAARLAEEDAIAAFLASKGVTKVPAVGDAALRGLPDLEWDKSSRKWGRKAA